MMTGSRQQAAVAGGGGWWWWVMFAVISAVCVSGPALYLKFHKAMGNPAAGGRHYNYYLMPLRHHTPTSTDSDVGNCPVCACHCAPSPPPPSLLHISPGLANLSAFGLDCGHTDPDLKLEMSKQFVDLLTEELKLQQGVATEHAHHMNLTLTDARRVAFLYQREADKCVAATETCEAARERSESFLRREIKLTSLWEQRARSLGWHP